MSSLARCPLPVSLALAQAKDYARALRLYLQCGEKEIDKVRNSQADGESSVGASAGLRRGTRFAGLLPRGHHLPVLLADTHHRQPCLVPTAFRHPARHPQAILVVGKARTDALTHTLIDFLMGETDGVPKDPNYIFRLYMALGNYMQVRAARGWRDGLAAAREGVMLLVAMRRAIAGAPRAPSSACDDVSCRCLRMRCCAARPVLLASARRPRRR